MRAAAAAERQQVGSFALLPRVVDAIRVLLVATGAIAGQWSGGGRFNATELSGWVALRPALWKEGER